MGFESIRPEATGCPTAVNGTIDSMSTGHPLGWFFCCGGWSTGGGSKLVLCTIWERGFGFSSSAFPLNLKELVEYVSRKSKVV